MGPELGCTGEESTLLMKTFWKPHGKQEGQQGRGQLSHNQHLARVVSRRGAFEQQNNARLYLCIGQKRREREVTDQWEKERGRRNGKYD